MCFLSETTNDAMVKVQATNMKEQVKRWISAQRKENKEQKLRRNKEIWRK